MSAVKDLDVIVIGRGLLGSATARHLALENRKVAVIGPTEQHCLQSGEVFASHYDETRVQRVLAQDHLWTRMNLESVRSWLALQELTGINFYQENGCVYVNNFEDGYLKGAASLAKEFGLDIKSIESSADLKSVSPLFSIDGPVFGIFEPKLAGVINPRKLVNAQLQAFQNLGGIELNEIVTGVSRSNDRWLLETSAGLKYTTEKVVVAAGAFTNFFSLIPRTLDFYNKSEVVIISSLSESEYLKIRDMPSLLFEIETEDFDGIYVTPPTKRADGSYILKLGLNQKLDLDLSKHAAMKEWFERKNYTTFAPVLERELNKLFPQIYFLEKELKPCVISRTVTENPYIGEVEDGLFVLVGCNGYSAMSSDAQGRQMAALVTNGRFDDGYLEENFKVVFK
jgi:sarcosine oxidase